MLGTNRLFMWFKKLFWKPKDIVDYHMKYLIVGIGNVGAKYDDTRHNVGFEVVDYMAEQANATWKSVSLWMTYTSTLGLSDYEGKAVMAVIMALRILMQL